MKKNIIRALALLFVCAMLVPVVGCTREEKPEPDQKTTWNVTSPDGALGISVYLSDDGSLSYTVKNKDLVIVETSSLGLDTEEVSLMTGLQFAGKTDATVSYDYTNKSGKHREVSGSCNQTEFSFTKENFTLKLIARAYNDGYAFRYNVTSSDETRSTITVKSENTEFALPQNSLAYVQPYVSSSEEGNFFSYEESFQGMKSNDLSDKTISMPMLYRVGKSDVYSLITESGLIGSGYYGSFLRESEENASKGVLQTVPTPAGKWAANNLIACPFTSPWRVGIVGDMATVNESELVEAVYDNAEYWKPDNYAELSAEEQAIYTYDWVEAGTTTWSWLLYTLYQNDGQASQRDWDLQKHYVDAAAEMGWKYVILDGGWDSGNDKKLTELTGYAGQKGVKIIIWMDALGSFNSGDYRRLCARLDKYSECGVAGIKIDFFDGQTQDGNNDFQGEDIKMIDWYEKVYQECAKRKMVVNCHGSNKPTGERRIYPNVLNREAIKGYEMYPLLTATDIVNSLFVRGVVGPTDFTPITTSWKNTISAAALMATSVAYESGMPCMSDDLSEYASEMFGSFYAGLPSLWQGMKFLGGTPYTYYCVARQAENGDWYVACINNGETASSCSVDFSFLEDGRSYCAEVFTEGNDYRQVNKTTQIISSSDSTTFDIGPGGGFVIKITK